MVVGLRAAHRGGSGHTHIPQPDSSRQLARLPFSSFPFLISRTTGFHTAFPSPRLFLVVTQYKARGMFHTAAPPSGGAAVTMPALLPVLSGTPGATRWAGPELGEHTEQVRPRGVGEWGGREGVSNKRQNAACNLRSCSHVYHNNTSNNLIPLIPP